MARRRPEAACDAVKIRWRKRRTLSSTARQSIARESRVSSSGPFTATFVAASNLPFGSGVVVIFLFTGSPDRVSALSGRATGARIRPVIGTTGGGASHSCPGFPLPFGRRRSLLGHPIPAEDWAFLAVGLPAKPDPDGVTAFRTHELRPGWVPPKPRGRRCSPRLRDVLNRRLPLHRGQSLDPAPASHRQGSALRGINKGSRDSPVRSSPRLWPPGWNGRPLGFPPSFAPRRP
jgi:hypothetical protein